MEDCVFLSPLKLPDCCFSIWYDECSGGISDFEQECSLEYIKDKCNSRQRPRKYSLEEADHIHEPQSRRHIVFYCRFPAPDKVTVTCWKSIEIHNKGNSLRSNKDWVLQQPTQRQENRVKERRRHNGKLVKATKQDPVGKVTTHGQHSLRRHTEPHVRHHQRKW